MPTGKYQVETEDGSVYEIEVDDGPVIPTPPPSWGGTAIQAGKDLLGGIGSGLASTVFQGGDIIRRGLGMERVIERPEVQQLITPPPGLAGGVGYGAEQIAEFLIPGSIAAKGAKAIQASTKVPGLVKAIARPAMEAASAGAVAGVQSGGKPSEMGKAAGITGAMSAIVPGARAAKRLKDSAVTSYSQALRATKGPMKKTADKIIPELIERRTTALSLEALEQKAKEQVASAGQKLDDAIDALAADPKTPNVKMKPILDAMNDYKQGFIVNGVPIDKEAIRAIDGLQGTIKKLGPDLSIESIRKVRQILDKKVAWRKGFVMPVESGGTIDATKEATNAIRREFAKEYPDIAKLNKEFSFWKKVDDVVSETVERTRPQAPRLGERMMTAAGAAGGLATGGISGAVMNALTLRALTKLVNSTAWHTFSAVNKDRLANLIASGKAKDANAIIGRALAGAVTDRSSRPAEIPPPPR